MPVFVNPAEYLLELTSSDFIGSDVEAQRKLDEIHENWRSSQEAATIKAAMPGDGSDKARSTITPKLQGGPNMAQIVMVLLHRSFIKSNRDLIAYWIRFAMYLGLAVMMGTVWLRLSTNQSSIQPFINAIVR